MGAKKRTARRAPARPPARSKRTQPETLRLRSADAGFTVDDVERSVAWYRDTLGFTVVERWEEQGRVVGATLKAGRVRLMIGQDDWKKGRDRVKGEGFRLFCQTVQDVDALAARFKANGATLTHEPTNQPWGVRDFGVTDPDGFKLTIYSSLP